jgi:hypothetical protein
MRTIRFECYQTRLDCIITSGEHAGSYLHGGTVYQNVDSENFPELFLDGEPAEIVSHEAMVRITRSKELTEIWQSRGFTAQQIKEIRYYRKGGPSDGAHETQRFMIAGVETGR